MSVILIAFATICWIVMCSIAYGWWVGRNVDECASEAIGFACASGFVVCVGLAMLGAA